MEFQDAQITLPSEILRAVEELGFLTLTEVQAATLLPAIEGKSLSVCAKTGSGKTAAFCLPILVQLLRTAQSRGATRALVLAPTRELALQIQVNFNALAKYTQIKSGLIIGGEAYKHQVATLRRNPEVVIATPGRLVEHVKNRNTDFTNLECLVLDEADRMLDMGFQDDMELILAQCNKAAQKLFFSATLNVEKAIFIQQHNPDCLEMAIDSHRSTNEDVSQYQILADDLTHKKKLVSHLCQHADGKVMVFCKTRAQCQQLSNLLQGQKIKSAYIHGELLQNDRKQILNRFRDDSLQVLVATDVAARGLDITDVVLVVNFTVAQSGEEHIHRVGRTGRANRIGQCVTLVAADEWNLKASIERYLNVRFKPMQIAELKANYTGPKKLKNSGKAATAKKKPKKIGSSSPKRHPRPASTKVVDKDGHAPIKRKIKPQIP